MAVRKGARPARRTAWERLPREALMKVRLRDLHVSIEGSWLEPRVAQLRR